MKHLFDRIEDYDTRAYALKLLDGRIETHIPDSFPLDKLYLLCVLLQCSPHELRGHAVPPYPIKFKNGWSIKRLRRFFQQTDPKKLRRLEKILADGLTVDRVISILNMSKGMVSLDQFKKGE